MAVFLPGYQWVTNARNGGGNYETSGPASILLHMTVSMGVSAGYISGHPYPPHLWANPYNGDRFQTVTLDRSAFALYQPDYGNSWTNRKGYTLQTEVVGVPEVSVATFTDAQCKWIGEQVVAPQARWLASIGKPVNLNHVRYHPETGGSASDSWPGRMSEGEWDAFDGLLAHIDVPYNDHWDCSAERLDHIAAYARAALGGVGQIVKEDWLSALSDQEQRRLFQMTEATFWATGNTYPSVDAGANTVAARIGKIRDWAEATYWMCGNVPPNADNEGRTVSAYARDAKANTEQLLAQGNNQPGTTGPPAPTVGEVLAKATDIELFTEIARRAAQPRPTAADSEEGQPVAQPPTAA